MSDELLQKLMKLCKIPSESKKETEMAKEIAASVMRLGIEVRDDGCAGAVHSETGNQIVSLPPSGGARRWVSLFAHLDAVPPGFCPEPYIDGDIVKSRSGILAADDRAGVAIILQILEDLMRKPFERTGVQAIFTVSEETGVGGAHALKREDIAGDWAVVLDTGGRPGQITVQSPEACKFRAFFKGRAAHAGIEPEKGVNALLLAAKAATSVPTGRLNQDTTFSITVLKCGEATNVIPGEAVMEGEARSFEKGQLGELFAGFKGAAEAIAEESGGRLVFETLPMFSPYDVPRDHPLVSGLLNAAAACGFKGEARRSGGGSDANPLSAKGVTAVNLAIGYREAHGPQEHLVIPDFVGTYSWVSRFLAMLDSGEI